MCQCIYKKDFFRFRCGPLEFFTGSISWPDEAWGGGGWVGIIKVGLICTVGFF